METQDWTSLKQLFNQAHHLVWRKRPNQPGYRNVNDTEASLSDAQFRRLANLTGQQITWEDVEAQCPARGRATINLGPQQGAITRVIHRASEVQRQMGLAAAEAGWKLKKARGAIGVYAPSPFRQAQDAEGVWRPANPELRAGLSGGACSDAAPCQDGTECLDGVCVIPLDQRRCPSFQFPVALQDPSGPFQVPNPSARRTRLTDKYSTFFAQPYQTCGPEKGQGNLQWLPADPRYRRYLGLTFHVAELPEPAWQAEVKAGGHQVFLDPQTQAPYFRDLDNRRVYKLHSAFSLQLDEDVEEFDEPVDEELEELEEPDNEPITQPEELEEPDNETRAAKRVRLTGSGLTFLEDAENDGVGPESGVEPSLPGPERPELPEYLTGYASQPQ